MTWVILRQNRIGLVAWSLGVAALAIFAFVSGQQAWGTVAASNLRECFGQAATAPQCANLMSEFTRSFNRTDRFIFVAVMVLPALLGVFGAAPLAAGDLEQGTYKFTWTQAVGPRRWFGVRTGVMLALIAVSAGVLSAALSPWLSLTELLGLGWNRFAEFPPTLLGYLVFAAALGLAAGLIVGRSIPAAAIALVAFVLVRVAFEIWLRPNLLPPHAQDNLVGRIDPNDWYLGPRYFDPSGQPVSASTIQQIYLSNPNPTDAFAAQGIRMVGYYQPWENFWSIQAIETGLVLAASIALVAAMIIWVERIRS